MTKEKQIEEIFYIIADSCCGVRKMAHCIDRFVAETIYNAGYRKQNEGNWTLKRPNGSYYCSFCGKGIKIKYGERAAILWDFCPNCGAKMKGGE